MILSTELMETILELNNHSDKDFQDITVREFIKYTSNKKIKVKNDEPLIAVLTSIREPIITMELLLNRIAIDNGQILESEEEKEESTGEENDILPMLNLTSFIDYDPVIGRDDIIQEIESTILRRKKNSVLLIGDPGTGKTSIVEELARRIVLGRSSNLNGYIIYRINPLMIKTYMNSPHGLAQISGLLQVISNKKIILFIDEMHSISEDERAISSAPSFMDLIKPYLSNGDVHIIGSTTGSEAKKYILWDAAIKRRFNIINVKSTDDNDTKEILRTIIPVYEMYHKISIENRTAVIDGIVKYGSRYLSEYSNPDRSIEILDQTMARFSNQRESSSIDEKFVIGLIAEGKVEEAEALVKKAESKRDKKTLDLESILETIAIKAKIPIDLMKLTDIERLQALEKNVQTVVYGQDEATSKFVDIVKAMKTGMSDPLKPASIMLAGPTGTGKTLTAKTISDILFDGRKESFIRIDMGEYKEAHKISTLLGSPPGYVDSHKGGSLTERVQKNPYSLILLDEIEKAHPSIIDIFLGMLDNGYVTDSISNTVDFRNCIVVMTTNAGMENVIFRKKSIGFGESKEDKASEEELIRDGLKKHFKPEFVNRIDHICIFKYLEEAQVYQIIEAELAKVIERVGDKIKVVITADTKERIYKKYYEKEYGGRSIVRGINNEISKGITDAIINGQKEVKI